MKVFILYCSMVNIKMIFWRVKEICFVCFVELDGKDVWFEYVLSCVSSMMVCKVCYVFFKKKEYLQKYMWMKYFDVFFLMYKDISYDQEDDSDWDVDFEV